MELPKFDFTRNRVTPHRFSLPFMPDKDAQKQALKASGQGDLDLYDLLSEALTAGMAASGYGIEHAYKAVAYIPKVGLDGLRTQDLHHKTSAKRNPLIPEATGNSPVTHNYLMARRMKKIGGNLLQGVASALSAAPPTAVNIPGTIYHGHAVALTAVHMARIEYISRNYVKSVHDNATVIRDWCALIRTMKTIKTAVRGTQLVGSVIPLASIPTSILSSVMKMGIKLTAQGACYAAAAQLQCLAYKEQGFGVIAQPSRNPPPVPPDSRAPRRPLGFTPMPTIPENSVWPPPAATRRPPGFTPMPTISENSVWPPQPAPPQKTGPEAGPASSVIWEIFTKRGATRLLGKYDVSALIEEPAGWMALADKLLLI